MILLPLLFLFAWDCTTAKNHAHDQLRDATIDVTLWQGCVLQGKIGTTSVTLFAESSCCSALKAKTPGTLAIRYDVTCSQVVAAMWPPGTIPPEPTPSPTPLPTPPPGSVNVSGYVKVGGAYFGPAVVTLTASSGQTLKSLTTGTGGYFDFPGGGNPGDVLTVSAAGYTFPSVVLTATAPYYILNGTASGPVPTPTPSPQPTPSPTLRKVAWPSGESAQDAVIATQWAEGYRFKRNLRGSYAEFELVKP